MSADRPSRIVFCCTANRIRSVFAERAALQLRLVPPWLGDIPVVSRGTHAWHGEPAWPEALEASRILGIDLGAHSSRALEPADLDNAWFLAMTGDHLVDWPGAWRRQLLGTLDGSGEIADPVGMPTEAFIPVFEQILSALLAWSRLPAPS